jgi:hypothetical protein
VQCSPSALMSCTLPEASLRRAGATSFYSTLHPNTSILTEI